LDIAASTVQTMPVDGHTDPSDPSHKVRPEKVVGETGLLLLAAARAASANEIRERIEFVARLVIPLARAEHVRARVCLEPSLALEHSPSAISVSPGLVFRIPDWISFSARAFRRIAQTAVSECRIVSWSKSG
jgi:hypothetical protein